MCPTLPGSEFRGVLPAPGGRPVRLCALPLPLARPPRPARRLGLGALSAVPPPARVTLGRHDVPLVRRLQVRQGQDWVLSELAHVTVTVTVNCYKT